MAEITNGTREQLEAKLQSAERVELVGQELVQRGAIHAITWLLDAGCTEENARAMLASLNQHMELIERITTERFPEVRNETT